MHTRIYFDVENLLCEVIQSDRIQSDRKMISLKSRYLSPEQAIEEVKKWYVKCNPKIIYAPVL